MVWFHPNSNSTKLLCQSWLPATLMIIQSNLNELEWRHHFPIKSLWENFRRSRAANSIVSGQIWPKFELVRDFMHVLVTCKYKKDRIKNNGKKWRHRFPHYKSMGAFCCHGNQSFYPICPKTLCSLSPTPVMIHIKFYHDWPTGLSDIQVWKCGRRTDDRPLVYYKLILWAFGSGALTKIKMCCNIVAILRQHDCVARKGKTHKKNAVCCRQRQ